MFRIVNYIRDSDVDKVAQFLRVKFYEDLCTELEDGSFSFVRGMTV